MAALRQKGDTIIVERSYGYYNRFSTRELIRLARGFGYEASSPNRTKLIQAIIDGQNRQVETRKR